MTPMLVSAQAQIHSAVHTEQYSRMSGSVAYVHTVYQNRFSKMSFSSVPQLCATTYYVFAIMTLFFLADQYPHQWLAVYAPPANTRATPLN